jgi:hypothetical protein
LSLTKITDSGKQGKVPSDRNSWQEAVNQVKGNINYGLKIISPEEYVSLIVESKRKQVRNRTYSDIEARYIYLTKLEKLYQGLLEEVEEEKSRTEKFLPEGSASFSEISENLQQNIAT